MDTTTVEPRRLAKVVGVCGRCMRLHPGRQPNVMVLVDYLSTRTVVAAVMRRGGKQSSVTPAPDGTRTRFYPVRVGRGAELECQSCLARPRRSYKVLRAAADAARAEGRTFFVIAD